MGDDGLDLGIEDSDDDDFIPADVYDNTFTFQEEPYFSFDRFDGLETAKTDLKTKVLQRLGMGRFSPASVLLFNDETATITEHVGKGLVGELPNTYTTVHVDSVDSDRRGGGAHPKNVVSFIHICSSPGKGVLLFMLD